MNVYIIQVHFWMELVKINQLFDDILIIWPAPVDEPQRQISSEELVT